VPKATFSATPVDFGGVGCGQAAPADRQISVKNEGSVAFTWTAILDKTDAFSVKETAGTVEPGATGTITIAAKPVPLSAKAGATSSATLTITTSDPAHAEAKIPVSLAAEGATFELSPASADFGGQPVNVAALDQPFTLKNIGNKEAQVSFGAPTNPDFSIAWTGSPGPATVKPGDRLPGLLAHYKPTSTSAATSASPLEITGARCGVQPDGIALKGQGTNGLIAFAPSALDFGLTNCGSTAGPQSIKLVNVGNAHYTWGLALGKGQASAFTVSSTGGVLLPDESVVVTVTPKPVPFPSEVTPNLYGDTLTLTSSSSPTPTTIALTQTARGVIVTTAVVPPTLDLGSVQVGTNAVPTIAFTNGGNIPTDITFNSASGGFPAGKLSLAAGATGNATFKAVASQYLGSFTDTSTIAAATGNLCKPLPAYSLPLTGKITDRATKVYAGAFTSLGVGVSKTPYLWGQFTTNNFGDAKMFSARQYTDLKDAAFEEYGSPTRSGQTFCTVRANGTVGCTGTAYNGSDVTIPGIATATAIAGTGQVVCAVINNDTLQCWATPYGVTTPTVIAGASGVRSVAVQGQGNSLNAQICVNKADDTVECATTTAGCSSTYTCVANWWWGGCYWQWQDSCPSTAVTTTAFTAVAGLSAKKIVAGQGHTCAQTTAGGVQCWGANGNGELGNGNTTASTTPVDTGLAGITELAAGGFHSCAIGAAGAVSCWGLNSNAQLGNDSTTASNVPVAVSAVSGLTGAVSIAAGTRHSCAVKTGAAGGVFCWGNNGNGNGQVQPPQGGADRHTPVVVPTL
jgi:hypothetical protein